MNIDFKLWTAYLKTYSIQALLALAALNGLFATMSATDLANIPTWLVALANIAGAIVTGYLRTVPQPEASAAIARARASR